MRAAIYARVSAEGQDGLHGGTSLETQVDACVLFCLTKNHSVVQTFSETWTGAEWRERPSLSELRQAVRDGLIDVVVCYAVDRLARNSSHLFVLLDELQQSKCKIEFVTEAIEDSPIGQLVLHMRGTFAEIEREKIIERTQRGIVQAVKNGKPLTGRIPYGYMWRDSAQDYFIPNPLTAPVVKMIFDEVESGSSLRRICILLDARHIATPGGGVTWSRPTLRYILQNHVYTGRLVWRRTISSKKAGKVTVRSRDESEWITSDKEIATPLITAASFLHAQQRIVEWQAKPRQRNLLADGDTVLLNGGFLRCGECGGTLTLYRKPDGRRYYRCVGKSYLRGPVHVYINTNKLDAIVWDMVCSARKDPPSLEIVDTYSVDISVLEASLQKTVRQMENFSRGIGDADDDDVRTALLANLKSASTRKKELQAEVSALKSQAAAQSQARLSREAFYQQWDSLFREDTLTIPEKRAALEWLRVCAVVTKTGADYGVVVEYSRPMLAEEASCSTFLEHMTLVRLSRVTP